MGSMDRRDILTRPRHLLATVALALLLGAGGVTVVGVAKAQGAATQPLVVGFHIPLPNQGDDVLYDVASETTLPMILNTTAWRMTWLADHRHLRPDGTLVLANRLRYADTYANFTLGGETFGGEDGVEGMVTSPLMEAGQAQAFAFDITNRDQPETQSEIHYFRTPGSVPCEARNGLQGRTWTFDGEPIQESSGCRLHGHSIDPYMPPTAWRATATATLDGTRWVVLEMGQANRIFKANTTFWLQEGLPYPVRIERTQSYDPGSLDTGHSSRQVLTLRELRRGDVPIAIDPVESGVLPAIVMAPRGFAGPDATGVDHPFPLTAAIEALRADDELGPRFAAWMAAHPQAYVGSAYHTLETNDRGQTIHEWIVFFTDGVETIGYGVRWTAGPLVVAGLPNVPAVVAPVDQDPSIDVTEQGVGETTRYPTPEALPVEAPTVASMRDAYEFLRATEDAPLPFTGWDFDLRCDDDECVPRLHATAGHKHRGIDWNDQPAESGDRESTYDRLTLTWNGTRLIGSTTMHWGPADASATDKPISPTAVKAAPHPGAWMPLTAGQAAGVGLAAALLAILYWLSPLAKSGAAGLFTRIRQDEILDHPNRALLMRLVEASPGIHYQELRRRAGLAKGVLHHHLEKLEAAGQVRCDRASGYTCYFPANTDRRLMQGAGVLSGAATRHVFKIVCQRPGINTPGLTVAAGIPRGTLLHHLARLAEAGLVTSVTNGRSLAYLPTAQGHLLAKARGLGESEGAGPTLA